MLLTKKSIGQIWKEKLYSLAPRLKQYDSSPQALLKGDLKDDWGLDSLEVFELAAYFHGMFHLLEGTKEEYLLQYPRAEDWLAVIRAGANDFSRPISFFTSGSTGSPKSCTHDKCLLLQETDTWNTLLAPQGTLWSFVSPQHIYGFLFSVLLPDRTGLSSKDGRSLSHHNLEWFVKPDDWFIGIPDLYDLWLRSHAHFPSGVYALSSTAPLSTVSTEMLVANGLSVIEIYGSSESGGIGFRKFTNFDRPEMYPQAFRLLPFWEKKGHQLKRITTDDIHIKATVQQFFNPLDHLEWKGETDFLLFGRKDFSVQVAGHNVFPNMISQEIEQIPGVEKCWVKKMNSEEGNRLKAWIIPSLSQKDWGDFKRECYIWIESHLPIPERPKHITFCKKAPVNEMGDVLDWPIGTLPNVNLTSSF